MFDLLLPLAALIVSWVFLSFIFSGVGLLGFRVLGKTVTHLSDLLDAFWIGWAVIIAVLQIWHLFSPVNWMIGLVILLLSGAGYFSCRKQLAPLLRRRSFSNRSSTAVLALALVAIGVLADKAYASPLHYDTGLYHLENIAWFEAYAVIPGLANLHGRLGFNSSHFLYAALLESTFWPGQSHQLSNSLLMFVFLLQLFSGVLRLAQDNTSLTDVLLLSLLVSMIYVLLGLEISSPSTDLPLYILTIIVSLSLLHLLEKQELPSIEVRYTTLKIVLLTLVAVTIKLSAIAFTFASITLAFGIMWSRQHTARGYRVALGIAALVIIPWIVHGVIQSGYLAYPSPATRLNVSWAVPVDIAINDYNYIRSWARQPERHWQEVLGNGAWLGPWVTRSLSEPAVTFGISLLLLAALFLILAHRVKRKVIRFEGIWLFLIPALVSLPFWFIMAPEPRFVQGSFWVIGTGAFVLSLRMLVGQSTRLTRYVGIAVVILAIPGLIALVFGERPSFQERQAIPQVATSQFETASGLVLIVPIDTDQCWDTGLLCTPYPNPDLRLRNPERGLAGGFTVAQ